MLFDILTFNPKCYEILINVLIFFKYIILPTWLLPSNLFTRITTDISI